MTDRRFIEESFPVKEVGEIPAKEKNIRHGHELYCAGHLIEAAVAYWQATGKRAMLDVLLRYAGLIDLTFGPGKRDGAPGHPEIELALVKLYRATGERRWLDLARFLLDQRGQKPSVFQREMERLTPEQAANHRGGKVYR